MKMLVGLINQVLFKIGTIKYH